jgi:hypothetical protein
MSVWFCIPSCRSAVEAEACLAKWRALGYKIALLRQGEPVDADLLIPTGEYLGWARSTNILAKEVLRRDASASWLVGGGDDYFPDRDHEAGAIADECSKHFAGLYPLDKWGVMQPTGDRWGDSESSRLEFGQDRGAQIDRICGSPWMGREWCHRAYMGIGPMWPGYHHLYADEELHGVAKKLGVLWQRRDLTQYHNHPCRTQGHGVYQTGHLAPLYSPEAWAREREHFEDRKRKGFPGAEPL